MDRWEEVERRGEYGGKVVGEAWEAQMQKWDLELEGREWWGWERWRKEMSRRHREKDAERARGGCRCDLGSQQQMMGVAGACSPPGLPAQRPSCRSANTAFVD